jgi:lipid II:glycine glycyltransferase (peptidoglycan interpeptide bridge formation enzyme)
MSLVVRAISSQTHEDFIQSTDAHVSFLQLPQWGQVKVGWKPESIGFFKDSRLAGVALVLYRPIPKLPQRSLAYIPEGPVIRGSDTDVSEWTSALISHVKSRGAFQIKIGPPVAVAQWNAATVKAAIAQGNSRECVSDLPPDRTFPEASKVVSELQQQGWTQESSDGAGFGDVQPRFVFQVPLAGRSPKDILAGFNQQWRRNIRKAEKSGVVIRLGTRTDLAAFHSVYVETAQRDGFTPRGLIYFERMWDALGEHLTLHVAEYEGHVAAATIMVTVKKHAWYSYGASTSADRDVRPSNALQWHMIQAASEMGCDTYDLRGISNTLDPDNHLFGLINFKLGSGGYVQEYVGEWDFEIRKMWARAFKWYQKR